MLGLGILISAKGRTNNSGAVFFEVIIFDFPIDIGIIQGSNEVKNGLDCVRIKEFLIGFFSAKFKPGRDIIIIEINRKMEALFRKDFFIKLSFANKLNINLKEDNSFVKLFSPSKFLYYNVV